MFSQTKRFWLNNWRILVVFGYSIAVLSFSMPLESFPPKPYIGAVSERVLVALSLSQYWNMFAPSPRSEDIRVEVVYKTSDGGGGAIHLTDMQSMLYGERWQKERWRKYFNDHLRTDAESHLWVPYKNFVLRELTLRGIHPVELNLVRYWRAAKLPISAQLRPSVRTDPWMRYTFYTWHESDDKPSSSDRGVFQESKP